MPIRSTQRPSTSRTGLLEFNIKALVKKQLGQSISVITAVMNDEAIHEAVVQAAELTAQAMQAGRKLMVCGNGGSAADSQHLVAEFVSRLTVNRPAFAPLPLPRTPAFSPRSVMITVTVMFSSARSKRSASKASPARNLHQRQLRKLHQGSEARLSNGHPYREFHRQWRRLDEAAL